MVSTELNWTGGKRMDGVVLQENLLEWKNLEEVAQSTAIERVRKAVNGGAGRGAENGIRHLM